MHRVFFCSECGLECVSEAKRGPVPSRCKPCRESRASGLAKSRYEAEGYRKPYRLCCQNCGSNFWSSFKRQKTCSRKCYRQREKKQFRSLIRCDNPGCRKEFWKSKLQIKKTQTHYCCKQCFLQHQRPNVFCKNCNVEIKGNTSGRKADRKFCCKKCYFDYRWGADRPNEKRKNRYAANTKLRIRCKFFKVPHDKSLSRIFVLERDNYRCQSCGIKCNKEYKILKNRKVSLRNAEVDHIIPLSFKGSPGHVLENCQCLCRKCNMAKSSRLDVDYQMRLALN